MDIEDEVFPDVDCGRLFLMLERLPLYDGALTARAQQEADRTGAGQGGRVEYDGRQVEQVGSSGADLISHPAFAGLIEYSQV